MTITVLASIAAKLHDVDQRLEPFEELSLSFDLQALVPSGTELTIEERRGCYAEIAGMGFITGGAGDSPWGIFFRPMSSGVFKDGSLFYQPDAREADSEIVAYWLRRSEEVQHPCLRARYLDLSREIGRLWKKSHPGAPSIALGRQVSQRSIEAYLEVVARGCAVDVFHVWRCFDRALTLAAYIKDDSLLARAKEAALAYARAREAQGDDDAWWRADEVIYTRMAKLLTEAERAEVTGWLEEALARHANPVSGERFDPHHSLDAAMRLERWHGHARKDARSRTALRAAGAAFEIAARHAPPLTAIAWLEDLSARYRNAELTADVHRVDAAIKGLATAAQQSLKTASVAFELNPADIDAWLDELCDGPLDIALRRIAFNMITREDKLRELVEHGAQHAPVASKLKITIMGRDGFASATIGSVDDDMPGRIIHQAADIIGSCAPLLHLALERTRERLDLNRDSLMAYLRACPFFPDPSHALLKEGLDAWFAGDHVKSIHLLVPQVEAALREVLIALGESPYEPNRDAGGFVTIGMGSILHTEAFRTAFEPAARLHLLVLYTDPKGINLRNKLAHGMTSPDMLGRGIANWVIHSLILLGAMRREA
jgi:hypothetical protein